MKGIVRHIGVVGARDEHKAAQDDDGPGAVSILLIQVPGDQQAAHHQQECAHSKEQYGIPYGFPGYAFGPALCVWGGVLVRVRRGRVTRKVRSGQVRSCPSFYLVLHVYIMFTMQCKARYILVIYKVAFIITIIIIIIIIIIISLYENTAGQKPCPTTSTHLYQVFEFTVNP